jgi:hypothetical protein
MLASADLLYFMVLQSEVMLIMLSCIGSAAVHMAKDQFARKTCIY